MIDPNLINFFYLPNPSLSNPNPQNYLNLNGINNLTISNSVSFEQPFLLGGSSTMTIPNSACQFDVSFDRSFICSDPLLSYTGSLPINNAFIACDNDNRKIFFKNLYLTNYSAGFSVGELPVINTKFTSYSNLNALNSNVALPQTKSTTLDIPKLGSISIVGECSFDITNENNIFSFDYSLQINRQVFYSVGSLEACVMTTSPVVINFSVNSKISDRNISNKSWPTYKTTDAACKYYSFDILVQGPVQSTYFPIRNATLVSSEIQYSSTNTPEIKRSFIGYHGI